MLCESDPYAIREVAGVLYVCYLPTGKKLLAVSDKSAKGREIAYDFVAKNECESERKRSINN